MKTITYKELTPEVIAELGKVFWGAEDEEQYSATDPDEAIEEILDAVELSDLESFPIVAMRTVVLTANDVPVHRILEPILEYLDEEYSNPDGDGADVTPAMEEAARALAAVIVREYEPWACKEVLRVEVEDPVAWIKEYRPDWLEEVTP